MKSLHLKFVFNRLNELKIKGEAPVQLRITLRRKSSYVAAGFKLKANQWNEKKQLVKNHENAVKFNLLMNRQKDRAFKHYIKLVERNEYIESKDIATFLKGGGESDFNEFVENQFDAWAVKLKLSTMNQHRILKDRYLKKFRRKIPFESIGYSFVTEFQTFLLKHDNYRDPKKKLHQNYVNSMLSILRRYTNEALRLKLILSDPFVGFQTKRRPSLHRPLTFLELVAFENVDVSKRKAKVPLAKDLFLFGCWTGLRFSDMCELNRSNIHEDEKGLTLKKVLKKTKDRTRKSITLPLYDFFGGKPQKLIGRYIHKEDLFGSYDNKAYNKAIRSICKEAGISNYEEITGHDSRHTFGVLMGNMPGMTESMLAFFMGHSSTETTRMYFKQDELRANEVVHQIDWSKYK